MHRPWGQVILNVGLLGIVGLAAQEYQFGEGGPPFEAPGFNQVVWVGSPNYNQRPDGAPIDVIVLHHTAGAELSATVNWFANPESRVSAHFTIGRDGSIVQHVSTFLRAWHCGPSEDIFGRENINHYSVGIELDNIGDGTEPYPEAQLQALENLIPVILRRHPEMRLITSHERIAIPPGRKVDPINFPWERMDQFGIRVEP